MTAQPMKPCPWCQSNNQETVFYLWDKVVDGDDWLCWMHCENCGCNGPVTRVLHQHSVSNAAIAAWNRREPVGNPDELQSIIDMRIEELEEMVECNNMYRAHDLVLHEIATLKWVLSLKKE